MKNSPIQWTDHTWTPWLGCRKVSLGCDNCYIVRTTPYRTRHLVHGGRREELSIAYWKQPLGWNRAYAAEYAAADYGGDPLPQRPRVFPSLCDWLDDEVPITWLANFLDLIRRTPNLDWQLLTKRPQNFEDRITAACNFAATGNQHTAAALCHEWLAGYAPDNVWLGVSVETQKYADERIPLLLAAPARIRFLSCEPLLGSVDLGLVGLLNDAVDGSSMINWVICGGESDDSKITKARPMHPDWARGLRDQCAAAGVPFFFKQWGEWARPEDVPQQHWSEHHTYIDHQYMMRVGKHAAGRLLDGVEHNAMPA